MNKQTKTKLMGTAQVGSKGQIVIPSQIRELFGIEPGDSLLLLADIKKGIAIVKSDFVSEALSLEESQK